MNYYAGIDVSLEDSCICVIDANGKVVQEGKVSSEPTALIAWLNEVGVTLTRIGLEAGPLSQWLYAAMRQAGRMPANTFQGSGIIVEVTASGCKQVSNACAVCGLRAARRRLDVTQSDTLRRRQT